MYKTNCKIITVGELQYIIIQTKLVLNIPLISLTNYKVYTIHKIKFLRAKTIFFGSNFITKWCA